MREDKFKEYYYKYLNYADKEMIVCSEYRDKNINGNLYPVIVALFENKIVYSISPNYFQELQEILLKRQDVCENQQIIEVLNDYFLSKKMKVSIQIMLRKVKMKEIKLDISNVVDLDKNTKEAYFNSFEKNKNIDYMENKWQKMQKYKYIKGIIKDNKFVSVGFVSNIIENAANIVIQTKDKYKGNGYAKKIVEEISRELLKDGILPIYWVNENNKESLRVSESLEFQDKVLEIVVKKV